MDGLDLPASSFVQLLPTYNPLCKLWASLQCPSVPVSCFHWSFLNSSVITVSFCEIDVKISQGLSIATTQDHCLLFNHDGKTWVILGNGEGMVPWMLHLDNLRSLNGGKHA